MFAQFVPGKEGYQFDASYEWVRALGITLKVGVDGLNVGLVLMGAIVALATSVPLVPRIAVGAVVYLAWLWLIIGHLRDDLKRINDGR